MMIKRLHLFTWVIALAMTSWLLACSCGDVTEPKDEKKEEVINPYKPNANTRILSQKVMGSADKSTSLYQMEEDGAGGYYFRGFYNSTRGVGSLGVGNAPRWFAGTVYHPGQILTLPSSAIVPKGLLAVGYHDTDSDGLAENSYVSLYDFEGNLLSQLIYSSGSADYGLAGVAMLSDSTFLAVGIERSAGEAHPLLATIALTPPGNLEKRHQASIDVLQDRSSYRVAIDPSALQPTQASVYLLSGGATASVLDGTLEVERVTAGLPSLNPCTVDWARPITVGSGFEMEFYDLCIHSDALYLVGHADDAGKEPRPSGGGYWDSGLVASLTLTGEPRWQTTVALTQNSERLFDLVLTSDALYAIGSAAVFSRSGQEVGYGWISKIAPNSGAVVANMTFGADTYRSGFNTATVSGTIISCGGYTNDELTDGPFSGWFCEIDVSNAFMVGSQMPPAGDLPGASHPGDLWENDFRDHPEIEM